MVESVPKADSQTRETDGRDNFTRPCPPLETRGNLSGVES